MIRLCAPKRSLGHLDSIQLSRITRLALSTAFQGVRSQSSTTSTSENQLPSGSEIVIAGGGVVGCSTAFHLAKHYSKDVILLEQGSIGGGTTWHAAGLIGALKSSLTQTLLSKYATELYGSLEELTGQGTGFKRNGSLTVAKSKDRATYIRRLDNTARQFGIETRLISPKEAQELWPLIDINDIKLALHVPHDGVATSSDVCNAFMKGAKQFGAKIFEKTKINKVVSDGTKVVGVETDQGFIECKYFVNACGQWSREMGMRSEPKVHVPLHSCEHFYIVTKPMEGVHDMLPTLRDQDNGIYVREWSGGLMCGGFEKKSKPCFYDKIPDKFEFQLLAEDWPHFIEHFMDGLVERIPSIQNAEIRQFLNGPESFTVDGNFLVGEVPELRNYYVGAAMNSAGIVGSGGVGKVISELICEGKPSLDISALDIRRMPRDGINKMYLRDSVKESLGHHYMIPYAKDCIKAARPMKTSPLYGCHDAVGAKWSVIGGWERADWFSNDIKAKRRTFAKPCWLKPVQDEYEAARDGVGLADLGWQSVIEISGSDLALFMEDMQHIFASDIDIPVNSVTQSALLGHDGKYFNIVELVRISPKSYLAVTLPTLETKLTGWLRDNAKHLGNLKIATLSGGLTRLALMGKRSHEVLTELCHPDDAIHNLEMDQSKVLSIGYASDVRIVRGFLEDNNNWELFVPSQYSIGLRQLMQNAVENCKVKDVGYYAIESMEISKKIVGYGNPLLAGQMPVNFKSPQFVELSKPVDFIGKSENVKAIKGTKKNLMKLQFPSVDEQCWVWGGEPVLYKDEPFTSLISAAWDYETLALTGLAILPDDAQHSDLKVLVADTTYSVKCVS